MVKKYKEYKSELKNQPTGGGSAKTWPAYVALLDPHLSKDIRITGMDVPEIGKPRGAIKFFNPF
jgi:hypothetical protein